METDHDCSSAEPAPVGPAVAAPETEPFVGPAPFYRRGRVFVQGLAYASERSSDEDVVRRREDAADQFLRVVEACEDPEDLHDFIAGVSRETKRQFARRHLTEVCGRSS